MALKEWIGTQGIWLQTEGQEWVNERYNSGKGMELTKNVTYMLDSEETT